MITLFYLLLRSWLLRNRWKTDIKLHKKLLKIGKILESDTFFFFPAALTLESNHRYGRAQLALSKGDEDLAREALKRRKSYAVSTFLYLIGQ